MINCEYYVPAWEGSKTSGKQPDFCLKYKVPLNGYCIKNCEVQTNPSMAKPRIARRSELDATNKR